MIKTKTMYTFVHSIICGLAMVIAYGISDDIYAPLAFLIVGVCHMIYTNYVQPMFKD